jgi:hypothetical protein
MNKIVLSKRNNVWFAVYMEKVVTVKSKISDLHDEFHWRSVDSVDADSFGELMIKIGEKKWVDEIQKSQ